MVLACTTILGMDGVWDFTIVPVGSISAYIVVATTADTGDPLCTGPLTTALPDTRLITGLLIILEPDTGLRYPLPIIEVETII